MKTLALASAALLFPVVAVAQQPADERWSPWVGCWELVLENARDAAARPAPARRPLPSTTSPSRPQICIEPSGSGVTLTTRVAGQQAIQQTINADGRDHLFHRERADVRLLGVREAVGTGLGERGHPAHHLV